jgi:hypothetical protein
VSRRYSQHLGALACEGCGRERADDPDRARWLLIVRRGALERVLCPRCQKFGGSE